MNMKPSGVQWIGNIPFEWSTLKLKYLVGIQAGYAFDSSLFSLTSGKPLIRIRDITSGEISTFYTGDYSNEYIVHAGDVLIGMDGDFNVRNWENADALLNQRCCRIIDKGKINKKYVFYCLPYDLQRINDVTYSTTVKHLSNRDVENISVPIPPFEEQQAIVDYLDDRCSKIDEIIAEAMASIEEYKKLKHSVIFEAVTKGLDKNGPMKDSGVEWIGAIPTHWKRVQLRYLLDKSEFGIKVGPFGSSFTNKTVGDGDYLIYGQANVISRDFSKTKNSVTSEVYDKLSRYAVVPGDICLSVIGNGTIGWCCTVPKEIKPGIMDSHLMKIRLSDMMINEFFELFYSKHFAGVCHTQMQYQKTGIAMEGLNTRIVKGLWMVVPPIQEQQLIVDKMEPFIFNMDSIISEKQALVDDLQAYKKSLIYEVVTGKRRVV